MRTTKTVLVEKQVTTYKCDLCDYSIENNSGCCGSAPIMQCSLCRQDCCRDCRTAMWEHDWNDYPDMMICNGCQPKGQQAWDIAQQIAGRYEDLTEITKKVFENFDEYKWMLGDDNDN